MPNIYSKSPYVKKTNGVVLKRPQLKISIKLIKDNFEYTLNSADRMKPTTVFHINRRHNYSLSTKSTKHLQRHMPSGTIN